ncbi:MAG: hypothetical protein K2H86_04165, partial [Muribaculaceae bacterium]|nr:hypothetical protein [Muribaculaceae bacterium]
AMIVPVDCLDAIIDECNKSCYSVECLTMVRGNRDVEPKRIMIQLRRSRSSSDVVSVDKSDLNSITDELTIEYNRGNYTEQYKALTKDFYLKF